MFQLDGQYMPTDENSRPVAIFGYRIVASLDTMLANVEIDTNLRESGLSIQEIRSLLDNLEAEIDEVLVRFGLTMEVTE